MAEKNKKSFSKDILIPLGYQVDYKSQKLSLKQRIQIYLRKDMTGRTHPRPLWIIIAIITVLALLVGGGKLESRLYESKSPAPIPVQNNEVQLSFVGDVMLSRYVESFGEKESYASLFRDSQKLWNASELVFANLECSINKDGLNKFDAERNIRLASNQKALEMSAKSGINVVSLANNHVADFGRNNVHNLIDTLQQCGIEYAGAGANRDEAGKYRLIEADGLTVGFVACTEVLPEHFAATNDDYGVCSAGYPNLYENVLLASLYSDFVVVYVHWGNENDLKITKSQREIAQRLIDCGASVVIGSHPHILQEVEQYKNGIVFYSLGNYIFDQASRQARNTMMVQLNANKTTGEGCFTLIPMRINNFHPYETSNKFYVSEIHKSLLKSLPDKSYTVLDNGRIQIPIKLFTPGNKQDEMQNGFDFFEISAEND